MFQYISGKVAEVGEGKAVIDVNGVGFLLQISDTTAGQLAAASDGNAKVYTYMNVREDLIELYGFAALSELDTFRMLIGISGIGPRAALAILSVLSPEKFALCVLSDDAKSISAAQGVGLKTAQKIILELKDKISKAQIPTGSKARDAFRESVQIAPSGQDGVLSEAVNALCVLGYTRIEAAEALSRVASDGMPLEKLIREGLRQLNTDK